MENKNEKLNEAIKRYKPLIKFVAGKNCIRGHHTMNFEDIEAECYCVMAKCMKTVDINNIEEFDRYFKRSMYNKIRDMWRYIMKRSNDGKSYEVHRRAIDMTIDLSEMYNLSGSDKFREMMISDEIKNIRLLVSKLANDMLDCVLTPSDKFLEYVKNDYLNNRKTIERMRIKKKHIAGFLNIPCCGVTHLVEEVRIIMRQMFILRGLVGV